MNTVTAAQNNNMLTSLACRVMDLRGALLTKLLLVLKEASVISAAISLVPCKKLKLCACEKQAFNSMDPCDSDACLAW